MEMIVRTIETLDIGLTSEEKMALKKVLRLKKFLRIVYIHGKW